MSFKYSAIGDNTPENREHCEKVGYKKHFLDRGSEPLLHTWVGSEPINTPGYSSLPIDSVWNPDHPEYSQDMIDCRNNPALFRAVTAIRDDSGIHQLYTDGNNWVESDIHDLLEIPDYLIEKGFNVSKTHKASLEELKEHFKNTNNE